MSLKLFIKGRSVSVLEIGVNLYVPTALMSEWKDPRFDKLVRSAIRISKMFPKDIWLVTSILGDLWGAPRSGSHGRGVALDITLVANYPSVLRSDGKSSALDQRPIPLTFMAQREWEVSVFAEGDHFHLQLNDEPGKALAKGVFTAKGYRPASYVDDGVRAAVPRGDYFQVMPNGEFRLRNYQDIFAYMARVSDSKDVQSRNKC